MPIYNMLSLPSLGYLVRGYTCITESTLKQCPPCKKIVSNWKSRLYQNYISSDFSQA